MLRSAVPALACAALCVLSPASAQSRKLNRAMPDGVTGDVVEIALSPDGTRLVYRADANVDETFELFSVPSTGGAITRLNGALVVGGDVGSSGLTFRISPDSSRVVYIADQDANDVLELYSVPIGGGSVTKLNAPLIATGDVVDFSIASDSSRVVYRAVQGSVELYSVPIAGGAVTKLDPALVASGGVTSFAISANSSRVVYRADQATNELFDLYSVPLAGGVATKLDPALVANGDVLEGYRISADSSHVVYLADQVADEVYELFSVPLAGGAATKLNPALVTNGDVGAFEISANSARVVYSADQVTDAKVEIYSVPLAGGEVTKLNPPLVAGGGAGALLISPDSSRVVYTAVQDTQGVLELYSVPIAGGSAVKLSPPLTQGGNVVFSTYNFLYSPPPLVPGFAISPDSSRVVFLADADTDQTVELFGAPLAGGAATKLNAALVNGGAVDSFGIAPDSGRVVYRADQDVDGLYEFFSVPVAGGTVVQVSSTSPALSLTYVALFTPDSSSVVYLGDPEGPGTFHAYRAPVTGGPSVRLDGSFTSISSAGDVTTYAVSPDGRTVVYRADQDYDELYELYSVPATGGAVTKLSGAIPGTWDVESFQISADSRRVVYRVQEVGFAREIFSVPIAGGPSTKLNLPLSSFDFVGGYSISPDAGTVVYTSSPDLSHHAGLYAVPIDGGASVALYVPSPLAFPAYEASYFEISPDSTRVVFQWLYDLQPPQNPYAGLFSVPITGGSIATLASTGGYCVTFDVTPDSRRVVFTANLDNVAEYDLYSVPIDGGTTVKLNPQLGGGTVGVVSFCPGSSCQGAPPTFFPSWSRISPDSSRVVFTASASSTSPRELYSAPIAGGMATVLSVPTTSNLTDAFDVSPDSTRVVYVGPGVGGTTVLYSVPIGGGSSTQLNGPLVPGGAVQSRGVISPDSSRVAYVADQDMDDVAELYSVPLSGGSALKLNAPLVTGGDVDGFGLQISADSRFVVYRADAETDGVNELSRASLDGSLPVRKLSGPLVAGGGVTSWIVSPDSRLAIYTADQDVDQTVELYASFLLRHYTLAPQPPRVR